MAEREQEPRRWTLTRYRNGELNGSCYGDIEDTEIVERIEVVEISSEAGPPRLEREEAELMLRLLDLVDGTHGLNTDELEFQAKLRALADTETGTPLGYRIPPEQIELVASALEFASTYAPEPNLEADELAASLRAALADTETGAG
jgi:hypothetical protein